MNEELPRILLVEDEKMLCDALADLLSTIPARVDTARTGDEAIKLMLENVDAQTSYRVVVLDLWMPKSAGEAVEKDTGSRVIDILHIANAYYQLLPAGTPIIIFTNHATIESCVSCMKAGAFDYLPKMDEGRNNTKVLLEKVRAIIAPQSERSATSDWLQRNKTHLIAHYARRCVAPITPDLAQKAKEQGELVDGQVVLAEESMKALGRRFLENEVLRWETPQFIEISEGFKRIC